MKIQRRVLVEGFYADIVPLGEEEKKALSDMSANDAELMRELGLAATDGAGRSLAELINEPSLNIDGLRSEYVGSEARTIIPADATATIDSMLKDFAPRQLEDGRAHTKAGYTS